MKIWNKIVIEPDGVINREESSWEEYEGPLVLAIGDDDDVPEISGEERAYQAKQKELLDLQTAGYKEQQQFQKDFQPFLFEQMGVEETIDPETGERSFAMAEDPARDLRKDLELKQLERSRLAFEGKLPVSPGLERGIASQKGLLEETLRKSAGRDFAASSIGTERLGDFFTRSEELREASRRGEMTQGIQTGLNLGGFEQGALGNFLSRAQGVSQGGLPYLQAGGNISGALGQAQQPFFNQRALQTQANIAEGEQFAGTLGSVFEGAGRLGAAYYTGGLRELTGLGQTLTANQRESRRGPDPRPVSGRIL